MYYIVAIRTIAKGKQKVAEGWQQLSWVIDRTEHGDLPDLLRVLQKTAGPIGKMAWVKTEVKTEVKEEGGAAASTSTGAATSVKTEQVIGHIEQVKVEKEMDMDMEPSTSMPVGDMKPISCYVKGKKMYKCPLSSCFGSMTPLVSYYGMDSHIKQWHTKDPYRCSWCTFSSYNRDSFARHEKTHREPPQY